MCRPRDPANHAWCDELPIDQVKPSKDPVPVLKAGPEARVDDALKRYAYKRCDPVVQVFAACAKGRLVTLPFLCRKERDQMVDCMRDYWIDEYRDVYRRAYGQRYPKAVRGWKTPEYSTDN